MNTKTTNPDRFDKAPRLRRVGVHRRPETKWWRWWMTAFVALAACVVLTAAGLFFTAPQEGEDPVIPPVVEEVEPITDPATIDPALAVTMTVLDGTDGDIAAGVAQGLRDGGWPVVADATASEIRDETVVYFNTPEQEAIARGVVEVLGVGSVQETAEVVSGSPITVVLGTDAVGVAPSAVPSASPSPTPTPAAP